MKQVLVDMDGVLADFYTQFQRLEQEETGNYISLESIYGKLEADAFPHFDKHVRSEGFFRTAPLVEGSREGLKYLNDKYKVLLVSSATEFPRSLTEKMEWMNEFFPFISWKQVILCGEKSVIKGDIMVDDHAKNLDYFDGQRILFTQPHNIYLQNDSYQRVKGWQDIMNLL